MYTCLKAVQFWPSFNGITISEFFHFIIQVGVVMDLLQPHLSLPNTCLLLYLQFFLISENVLTVLNLEKTNSSAPLIDQGTISFKIIFF